MAKELAACDGVTADFLDPEFLKALLSHLYQKLVRYTERNVRYASRLDHSNSTDPGEDAAHRIIARMEARRASG